ncbi:hypothetical protein K1719_017249 [Acacia pycnantha]|nr:hypothetical protein K1719_017249 [Acacia pycnantha]
MVLLVYIVLLLALTGHSSALYCVCKDGVGDQALQKALDYACGAGADCTPLLQNGACYNPNTLKDHCCYAVNSYFQKKGQAQGSCDFSGVATITQTAPASSSGCVYPSSASSSIGTGTSTTPTTSPTTGIIGTTPSSTTTSTTPTPTSTTRGTTTTKHLFNSPLNGACYNPKTVKDHCSYAVNSYFQKKGQAQGSCDFSGAATTSQTAPASSSGCVYPSSASSSIGIGTSTTPTTGITCTTPSSTTTSTTPTPTTTGTTTGTGPSSWENEGDW